jgi:hypothetical protein
VAAATKNGSRRVAALAFGALACGALVGATVVGAAAGSVEVLGPVAVSPSPSCVRNTTIADVSAARNTASATTRHREPGGPSWRRVFAEVISALDDAASRVGRLSRLTFVIVRPACKPGTEAKVLDEPSLAMAFRSRDVRP